MKTIITKLLILILIINAVIPMTAFANDTFALYNRGEEVILENDLYTYNGDKYIHEKDLYLINLEWDGNTLSDMYYRTQLYITYGSSTVLLNDESFLFPNASVKYNGNYYISMRLIGMFLSEIYEMTDSAISLWITDEKYALDFVKGVVSLPDNEVAPAGGITVEVFVTDPDGIAHGGAISGSGSGGGGSAPIVSVTPNISSQIGQLGYDGIEKPSYDYIVGKSESYVEYEKLVSKDVIIEEGNNSVEFYLSLAGADFSNSDVGYYTEINGHPSYELVYFSEKTELYEFVIRTGKTDIKGTVTLPEACEEDTDFVIVAEGEYGYKYKGTILAGNISSDYTLNVDTQSNYEIILYFPDGKFMREYSSVDVGNSVITDIDFFAERSNEYEITVSLPTDYTATEDINVDVYLQSATRPYYYIDKERITIASGTSSATVNMTDELGSKKVIVYYSLADEYDGLFEFGHYNSNGTSFDCGNAEGIKPINNVIEMTLLKSKPITANITLPDNEVAESDLYIDIDPIATVFPIEDSSLAVVHTTSSSDEGDEAYNVDFINTGDDVNVVSTFSTSSLTLGASSGGGSSGGGGGGSVVIKPVTPVIAVPTIAEGERSGTVIINIPNEDGYGYILDVRVSDDSDKYFRDIYYKSNKSTVIKNNATVVDNKTSNISIELIKQHEITGNINAIGFINSSNRITAICQEEESIIEDIYDSPFSVYTDIYGSGTYNIYVPDEFDKYILKLNSFQRGGSIYYNVPKSVEKIDDAKILTINGDTANVDFEYDGYNPPIPIKVQIYQVSASDRWAVTLSNISDFDKEDVSVRAALYKEGRLQKIVSEEPILVSAREKSKLWLTIPNSDLGQADVCKLFVWDNSLRPLADVTYIKDERSGSAYSETNIALLYAEVGNRSIYSEGRGISLTGEVELIDETVYLPLRAFDDALGMTIDWNADDREVTMEKDGNVFIAGLGTLSGTMNGTNITLHNELELVNSRVCAPVRDIAELFGYIVLGNTLEGKVSVYDQKNYLIEMLLRNNLIPVGVYGYSLDEKIYRRQIADVLVGLYEKVNGEIEITEDNPYTDVNSETIVKAYCSGILVGYEDGEFKPLEYVNRSEVIALFQRLLIKSGVSMPTDLSNTEEYTDITKDSDHWAREYVYQMNALGALDNVFEGEIGINDGATIKDVLSICQNCYELVVK